MLGRRKPWNSFLVHVIFAGPLETPFQCLPTQSTHIEKVYGLGVGIQEVAFGCRASVVGHPKRSPPNLSRSSFVVAYPCSIISGIWYMQLSASDFEKQTGITCRNSRNRWRCSAAEFLGCSNTHTRPHASARYMRMHVLSYPEIRKVPKKELTTAVPQTRR